MNKDLTQKKRSFSFEELLRFYQNCGVDIAVLDQPINRLVNLEKSDKTNHTTRNLDNKTSQNTPSPEPIINIQKTSKAPKIIAKQTPYIAYDEQVKLAQDMAMGAKTLEELYQNLLAFDGCPLKTTAKNTCFADGNANSALMIIGDVPEREEDIQGLPFVGQAGILLNKMLAAIDLNRNETYISNIIPWRPPGNREPTAHEIELCKPFIFKQIELVNPKVIIAFGGTTATWLTQIDNGILRMRGNWLNFTTNDKNTIILMPTLHPRYLLRNPAHKKFVWQDLLTVKMKLKELL